MQNLDKRIAALEKSAPVADKVLCIILVGMGEVGMEITHIHDNFGNEWNRLPDETEEDFKERASKETPRVGPRLPIIFGQMSHPDKAES